MALLKEQVAPWCVVTRVILVKVDAEKREVDLIRSLGARLAHCENIILDMLPNMNAIQYQDFARQLVVARVELCNITGRPCREGEPLVEDGRCATYRGCATARKSNSNVDR